MANRPAPRGDGRTSATDSLIASFTTSLRALCRRRPISCAQAGPTVVVDLALQTAGARWIQRRTSPVQSRAAITRAARRRHLTRRQLSARCTTLAPAGGQAGGCCEIPTEEGLT